MKKIVKISMWTVLAAAVLFVSVSVIIGYILSKPGYQGPENDHFNGTTFKNPGEVEAKGLLDVIKWAFTRDKGPWKYDPSLPESAPPPSRLDGDSILVTYVNHSTFLIQTQGLNILTDPVWGERVSPFSFAGPKRMKQPGISIHDIPAIDLILLSHNHYDHLDISTLKAIYERYEPVIIHPLGIDIYLHQEGITRTVALDWWASHKINSRFEVHCVPAQHFSGRGMFDRDKTLWGGFVMVRPGGNIYFAGDTGYGDFFPEIGQRLGPIRLSFLPIGAYQPRWFMSPVHISPDEAVQVHQEVNSQHSIAMHFGTFPLADEGMEQPVRDLEASLRERQVHAKAFTVLYNGEQITVK